VFNIAPTVYEVHDAPIFFMNWCACFHLL